MLFRIFCNLHWLKSIHTDLNTFLKNLQQFLIEYTIKSVRLQRGLLISSSCYGVETGALERQQWDDPQTGMVLQVEATDNFTLLIFSYLFFTSFAFG